MLTPPPMQVVEVNMKKEKSADEALDEARAKLVLALKRGYQLVLLASNSAPPLRSKFSSPAQLPYALVDDYASVIAALPAAGDDGEKVYPELKEVEWTKLLLRDDDEVRLAHESFGVVAVTKFEEADVAEFLGDEWPLDKMQWIEVKRSC